MRYLVVLGLLICILLVSCEYVRPNTSNALSQSQQIEEMKKQTQQFERQTEALNRLADSAEKLTSLEDRVNLNNP